MGGGGNSYLMANERTHELIHFLNKNCFTSMMGKRKFGKKIKKISGNMNEESWKLLNIKANENILF